MDLHGQTTDSPNIEALQGLLATTQAKLAEAEVKLVAAKSQLSTNAELIAHLKLVIAKMQREQYGQRSERSQRLIDQMELQLEELEANVGEDDLAAEVADAPADTSTVQPYQRRKPVRKPFPEHLPRERVIVPGPTACLCCGGMRLSRLCLLYT